MSFAESSLSAKCRAHRVKIVGNTGDFVLFAHGFGTDQTVWSKVLPALSADRRILLYDLAGAGPNAPATFDPARYRDIEAYADDLLVILHELGIRRLTYVGASVSGMIGVLAAIERPELFRKLILLGASPRYLNDTGYVGGFEQPMLDGLYQGMRDNYQGWVSGFAPLVVNALPDSEAVKDFSRTLFSLRPDIALASVRTIFQSDVRDRLGLLETPTVILQTRNDVAVPLAVGEYLRDHIKGATLDVINAEGHLPHLSAPTVVQDALVRHLA